MVCWVAMDYPQFQLLGLCFIHSNGYYFAEVQ